MVKQPGPILIALAMPVCAAEYHVATNGNEAYRTGATYDRSAGGIYVDGAGTFSLTGTYRTTAISALKSAASMAAKPFRGNW